MTPWKGKTSRSHTVNNLIEGSFVASGRASAVHCQHLWSLLNCSSGLGRWTISGSLQACKVNCIKGERGRYRCTPVFSMIQYRRLIIFLNNWGGGGGHLGKDDWSAVLLEGLLLCITDVTKYFTYICILMKYLLKPCQNAMHERPWCFLPS